MIDATLSCVSVFLRCFIKQMKLDGISIIKLEKSNRQSKETNKTNERQISTFTDIVKTENRLVKLI